MESSGDSLKRIKDSFGINDTQMRCNPIMGCGRELTRDIISSWSMITQKEYQISKLCNKCQDKVFGACGPKCGHSEAEHCTCSAPCCEADVGVGIITCGSQHCPVHGNTK